MAYGEARRKVFFYRALNADGGGPWDRDRVAGAIGQLTGHAAYLEDADHVNRAEVYSASRPQCIRFYKIRRDDLPAVDDGAGDRSDLGLAADEGLAEAIHICLFDNGVIGAEFFFYGPRINRFEAYVNDKLGVAVVISQLARHDVIDEALRFGEIRVLRIKLNPSAISAAAAHSANLDGLMEVASSFEAGVYADITLRAERYDTGLTHQAKTLFQKLRNGTTESNIFDKLEIEGKPDPGSPVVPLDLLSQRIYRTVEIPYRTQRYRDLNADAAFSAIRNAYGEVRDQVEADALG